MEFNVHIFAILSTIAIIFLLIGSVSATDIDANDTQIIYPNVDEILSVENDFDALNTDASTYSELINEIGSGGNIELKHDYYTYDKGSTIKITTDNSVINGKGATIDMAGSTIQTFSVSASGVTIKNLTIKNANYEGDGGTIYLNYCSCTVENCNFINNTAFRVGGAIYVSSDSEFSVENCNFINNTAFIEGGAIYVCDGSAGSVENCNFANNKADGSGGAIYEYGSGLVENCNFTDNSARSAGAVYFGSFGIITDCSFANNTATNGNGGAIWIYCASVGNCNFTGNNAKSGSAIYVASDSDTDVGIIYNSLFLNNRANAEDGFPLTIVKTENNIKIIFRGQNNLLNAIYSNIDIDFTNVTYWGANGITNTGSSSITPSRFNREAGLNITVVVVVNGTLVLNTTKVTDDDGQIILNSSIEDIYTITARHDADSYYTQAETTKTLNNPTNTYSGLANEIGSGGNIELQHNYYTYDNGPTIEITTDNSIIDGKGATIDMAGSNIQAFNVSASGVTIKNLTIKNSNYEGYGGAISFFYDNGELSNCNFINNSAGNGGAVYFGANGNIVNCNFINNSAGNGGAVCFNYDTNVYTAKITNCSFTNNTASSSGGAVRMIYGIVTECSFTDNTASSSGGAIFMGDGTISNCNFTNNAASHSGNAICFWYYGLSTGTVENCNFVNNKATSGGGVAVYFNYDVLKDDYYEYSYGVLGTFVNCNFTNNSGGAINMFEGTVTNCDFTNNVGIAINMFSGTIANCNFINSSSSAVHFWRNGEVSYCDFVNNNASSDGGAIHFNFASTGRIDNCNFINNTASGRGGAIYMIEGTVTNCNFTGNNATSGSAIFITSSSTTNTISNSLFLNNRANADDDAPLSVVKTENSIKILFKGQNNLLNAIYCNGDVKFTNVTYLGANGIANTGSSSVTPSRSNKEAGLNITVIVIVEGVLVLNTSKVTDDDGQIILDMPIDGDYTIIARHDADSYYTQAERTKTSNGLSTYSELALEIGSGGNISLSCNYYKYTCDDTIVITAKNSVINGNGAIIDMADSTIQAFEVLASNVTIKNLTIKNAFGGAIRMSEGTVTNCNFTNNRNIAIAMYSGTVANCNFIKNSADNGGAVYIEFGTVTNCNFVNNTAHGSGGAIWMVSGTLTDCNFIDNTASSHGGAVYFSSFGDVTNCNFTNDTTKGYGGAIYMGYGNFVDSCSFIACSADYGGGIYFNTEYCRMYDCYFKNNTANNGPDWYSKYDIKNELGASTSLEVPSVTATYAVSKKLTVTLKDVKGKALASQNIIVKVGTISKTFITDSNGQASIDVSTLIPETYSADIIFAGDDKYNASSATAKVTVKKATPKLTAKAKTFKKSVKTKKYTITLKNNKNKVMKNTKVTIKVNKKTYTAKTNSKGVATFKITKLNKKGTFKSTVTYNGNKYYNKVTKKVNIKIK